MVPPVGGTQKPRNPSRVAPYGSLHSGYSKQVFARGHTQVMDVLLFGLVLLVLLSFVAADDGAKHQIVNDGH